MTESNDPFAFLKGGDKQFESSMKSIDSMYDNLFKDDKLDKIFETFKVDNNKILDPIDTMSKQIFHDKKKQDIAKEPAYYKVEETRKNNGYIKGGYQSDDDEDDFVIGDPVYEAPRNGYYQEPPSKYFGHQNKHLWEWMWSVWTNKN